MTYPKITDDSENMVGSGSSIAKSYQVGYQVAVRHWRSHSCLLKLKMAFARLGSVLRKPLFLMELNVNFTFQWVDQIK